MSERLSYIWYFPRFGLSREELMRLAETEVKESMEEFPLAKFLYDNFVISTFGVFLTLTGTMFSII